MLLAPPSVGKSSVPSEASLEAAWALADRGSGSVHADDLLRVYSAVKVGNVRAGGLRAMCATPPSSCEAVQSQAFMHHN